jgi:hypothetical protein
MRFDPGGKPDPAFGGGGTGELGPGPIAAIGIDGEGRTAILDYGSRLRRVSPSGGAARTVTWCGGSAKGAWRSRNPGTAAKRMEKRFSSTAKATRWSAGLLTGPRNPTVAHGMGLFAFALGH